MQQFSICYHDICLQLNMFRAFSRPSSGAQWLQWQPLVLSSYRGNSRAVFVVGPAGRPARPRTQHDCHHDTKIKTEAATAVIELLMMGRKTSETFWAVNKRHKINWKIAASCWWFIWNEQYKDKIVCVLISAKRHLCIQNRHSVLTVFLILGVRLMRIVSFTLQLLWPPAHWLRGCVDPTISRQQGHEVWTLAQFLQYDGN
jgi:hypothetical protein